MEKVQIFIDSGNFYHLVLKKLGLTEVDFNFDEFVNFLANQRKITEEGKRFYTGTVRERQDGHESKKAMENQTKLFSDLINCGGWAIKTSKLRTRNEKIIIDNRVTDYEQILKKGIKWIEYSRSREKGIDVKLAVDLIVGGIDNKYDTAIIVSSDTDLVPAVDWVRKRLKKKVEYIGFSILYINPQNSSDESTKPTKTMIFHSDIQRVLVETDIEPFIKPKYELATKNYEKDIAELSILLNADDEMKTEKDVGFAIKQAVNNNLVWVAIKDNKIIGYVSCILFGEKHQYFPNSIFISELFVTEQHRKKGIGKKLIKIVLNNKFPEKYKYFSITHDPDKPFLTKFYKSFGFKEQGKTQAGNIKLVKNR